MKDKEIIDLILLNIGYAVHHADWNYKNVNSPFARIYMVIEGKAHLHLRKHTQTLTPGHLYIVPPFTLHSYACDGYFIRLFRQKMQITPVKYIHQKKIEQAPFMLYRKENRYG